MTIHSLSETFRREAWTWLSMSVVIFVLAGIGFSGFPQGLSVPLSEPLVYRGDDGLLHSWYTQRAMEQGWIFQNDRNGYPFGSELRDFPNTDSGNLLILKVLGMAFGSHVAGVNLHFLLGFPTAFISAYLVSRCLGLGRVLSVCGGFLFAFLPFHFLRFEHLFLTWYFTLPFFVYVAARLYREDEPLWSWRGSKWRWLGVLGLMFGLGMFGVYWSFFGGLAMAAGALGGTCLRPSGTRAIKAMLLATVLLAGVMIQVIASFAYWSDQGRNPEVAKRLPCEAEIYGLRISQMLLPRPAHRNPTLAFAAQAYAENYPLVNENATASLGVVGGAGLVLLMLSGLVALSGRRISELLSFLTLSAGFLVLYGTIGGLATPFNMLVSPMIRGVNRVSVLIGFLCFTALLWAAQELISRRCPAPHQNKVTTLLAVGLMGLAFWDCTSPPIVQMRAERKTFRAHQEFVRNIENALPPRSALYQMPYIPFPEYPLLHGLSPYDTTVGMLHSESLRWSLAGMKGRPGDLFYRTLAQESLKTQLGVVKRLGFRGIYIDRRGYEDKGRQVETELAHLLGKEPDLVSADGTLAFFEIPNSIAPLEVSIPEEVYRRAEYRPGAGSSEDGSLP